MPKQDSITNIPYKNYTNTSIVLGIPDSTSQPDSLVNIIKNIIFVYRISEIHEIYSPLEPGQQSK